MKTTSLEKLSDPHQPESSSTIAPSKEAVISIRGTLVTVLLAVVTCIHLVNLTDKRELSPLPPLPHPQLPQSPHPQLLYLQPPPLQPPLEPPPEPHPHAAYDAFSAFSSTAVL